MKAVAAALLVALAAFGCWVFWLRSRPDVVEHELTLRRADEVAPRVLIITTPDIRDLEGILDRALSEAVPATAPAGSRVVLEGTLRFYARTRGLREDASTRLSLSYDPGPPETWIPAIQDTVVDPLSDRRGAISMLRDALSRRIFQEQSRAR